MPIQQSFFTQKKMILLIKLPNKIYLNNNNDII